ncbi:hypothetical protein D1007_33858 [Hordeum vulgare]|nr:hypothetical protein D1007_33858 [Hordeum vulgare]
MDLLKVFFQRRIQRLEARAHLMWQYDGPDDQTRVHPEELDEEAMENKLRAITPVRDNLEAPSRPDTSTASLDPKNTDKGRAEVDVALSKGNP